MVECTRLSPSLCKKTLEARLQNAYMQAWWQSCWCESWKLSWDDDYTSSIGWPSMCTVCWAVVKLVGCVDNASWHPVAPDVNWLFALHCFHVVGYTVCWERLHGSTSSGINWGVIWTSVLSLRLWCRTIQVLEKIFFSQISEQWFTIIYSVRYTNSSFTNTWPCTSTVPEFMRAIFSWFVCVCFGWKVAAGSVYILYMHMYTHTLV